MTQSVDVAIIGGGIIGNTVAYFLAKEGLSVAILEAAKIASGSTKAAAGMLGAHSEFTGNSAFYSFAKESQYLYERIRSEVEKLSGIAFEHTKGGILQFNHQKGEPIHFKGKHILPEVIRRSIPNVNVPQDGGFLFTEDIHIHPIKTCYAFSYAARALGVSIYENTPVFSIDEDVIQTPSFELQANHIVITAGIESRSLLPLHLSGVKGQCMKLEAPGVTLPYTLFYEGTYMLQRVDGTLVVGATMELDDSEGITADGQESLALIAESFLHGSSQFKVLDRWYGFRPKTIDDLPYIGLIPNSTNVYVATGHFRNGILLAPATAKLIKDFILKNDISEEFLTAFNPGRGIATYQYN
ncbi:FAD-dependent oxidoreductase [Lederbergia lenta]|uniref:Glycine oxidase n=1 Tax=Lederbergia lenta TaxID=1467 RepID=A0A2X4WB20_LEDLE|nr:FAD-dependent oxidoreductase [Lederbergia lenta]MEC2325183.1 FAD-dependent oxidoreductase [Lederbergia lenta]SQI56062.1 glycine oxidase [Lederbergia lenta]